MHVCVVAVGRDEKKPLSSWKEIYMQSIIRMNYETHLHIMWPPAGHFCAVATKYLIGFRARIEWEQISNAMHHGIKKVVTSRA